MLFNTINFALFLPFVFILYWIIAKSNLKLQNILLLVASYFFYACWDYRFLFLLIFSTLLDYYSGLKIHNTKNEAQKKFWFYLSIGINLGFLGFFKYYNFFISSFTEGLSFLGIKTDYWTLRIILPVGISFYTFHGLSYVIDIFKNRISPEKNFINYSVFVSFFPLLVAGPIERATHLLPQVNQTRHFNYSQAVDGLRQILWGLFKKVVIADNCAEYANKIFDHSGNYSGSTLMLGAFFFAIQIYGDFSGYSDIALGTARLFGIELLRNFSFPYFSRDIAEFWRRWHISLSTWFRDYVYIPLGGSKGGTKTKIRNTFVIFILSGFWHGANWTFIIWGLLHALYFLPLLLLNKNRDHIKTIAYGKYLPTLTEFFNMGLTFILVSFAWIFFRAENLSHALNYISGLCSRSLFTIPEIIPIFTFILVAFFFIIEWLGREEQYAIQKIGIFWHRPLRWSFYASVAYAIFIFQGKEQEFIYFQF